MRRPFALLAAALLLSAGPAAAQSGPPTAFDWRSQLDRPGDYRCDAFWDAARTDCAAPWRDQRHRASAAARRDYRALAGYGRHDHGWRRRGYGQAHAEVWRGAHGRPDLVYPARGGREYGHGRDPGRIDWCHATYRSYDPASGYYRARDGRLIYCG